MRSLEMDFSGAILLERIEIGLLKAPIRQSRHSSLFLPIDKWKIKINLLIISSNKLCNVKMQKTYRIAC